MQNWLLEGLTALIAGMSTVFIILILISIIISLFKHIKPKNEIREKPTNKMQESDMNQVVAAISIALAVSLNTTVDKLKVKSIRRL